MLLLLDICIFVKAFTNMPNCPSNFVFAYEVCRALVDLVQFETGPNNSLPKTLYATNPKLDQGVVHILRNHFWGFRETPPPHTHTHTQVIL